MEDDAEWKAFVPGDGIVYLGAGKRPFIPTMLHEIRCIDIIRERVVAIGRSTEIGSDNTYDFEVANHCVNYLRQMVLCHSDPTLEVLLGRPGNAYGDSKICWDWEMVYDEVEKNQAAHVGRE